MIRRVYTPPKSVTGDSGVDKGVYMSSRPALTTGKWLIFGWVGIECRVPWHVGASLYRDGRPVLHTVASWQGHRCLWSAPTGRWLLLKGRPPSPLPWCLLAWSCEPMVNSGRSLVQANSSFYVGLGSSLPHPHSCEPVLCHWSPWLSENCWFCASVPAHR